MSKINEIIFKNEDQLNMMVSLYIKENLEDIVFNYPDETVKLFCENHSQAGMVNLKKKECKEPNCTIQPYFNFPGKAPEYCNTHKQQGMINVITKSCLECENTP